MLSRRPDLSGVAFLKGGDAGLFKICYNNIRAI